MLEIEITQLHEQNAHAQLQKHRNTKAHPQQRFHEFVSLTQERIR
jgi:hypothetical protein